jgi:hypothetical protein
MTPGFAERETAQGHRSWNERSFVRWHLSCKRECKKETVSPKRDKCLNQDQLNESASRIFGNVAPSEARASNGTS